MTPPPLPDVEKHKDFLQTRKEPYAIYLAINTNIKSYNNICPSEQYFWKFNDIMSLNTIIQNLAYILVKLFLIKKATNSSQNTYPLNLKI